MAHTDSLLCNNMYTHFLNMLHTANVLASSRGLMECARNNSAFYTDTLGKWMEGKHVFWRERGEMRGRKPGREQGEVVRKNGEQRERERGEI